MTSARVATSALLLLLALSASQLGCKTAYRASFQKPAERSKLPRADAFLKVHTHNGDVYVLADWKVDEAAKRYRGRGIRYNSLRRVVGKGRFSVPFKRAVLLETNQPERISPNAVQVAIMAVVTGASLTVSALCIAYSKVCFGSCPTFYAHDGEVLALQAEGFSRSVAKVFERTDLDALYTAKPRGRTLRLRMTNEALETHAVRSVAVLALPRPVGGRVLRAGRTFYPANGIESARSCRFEGGDCRSLLAHADSKELMTPTDPTNLATRETNELGFSTLARSQGESRGAHTGRLGIVLRARNSLVNTFLFYQVLAYMGRKAGAWIALLERGGKLSDGVLSRFAELLGEIRVSVLTRSRGWVKAGAFAEIGPIARDVQLVVLPEDVQTPVRVRLDLAKGYWKLDQVALAQLGKPRKPRRLEPKRVRDGKGRVDEKARALLRDPDRYLFTMPGAVYDLDFELPALPAGQRHELLLESRGYYYEWIRHKWLAEESTDELLRVIVDPEGFLRRMAPNYKRMESGVERIFWRSRVKTWR